MAVGNPAGFLQSASKAQAAHRSNLGDDTALSVLAGQDPAVLKMAPALAKQVELERTNALRAGMQHAPQMGMAPPALGPAGMGGGSMMPKLGARSPKPPGHPQEGEDY